MNNARSISSSGVPDSKGCVLDSSALRATFKDGGNLELGGARKIFEKIIAAVTKKSGLIKIGEFIEYPMYLMTSPKVVKNDASHVFIQDFIGARLVLKTEHATNSLILIFSHFPEVECDGLNGEVKFIFPDASISLVGGSNALYC